MPSSAEKYLWLRGREPPPLEPHSEAKHHLFRAYVNAYLNRSNLRPVQDQFRLTIVDGFCGGGTYRRADDALSSGSPIIFLEEVALAEQVLQAQRRKPFHLNVDFFFVDENREHCAYLEEEIGKLAYAERFRNCIRIISRPFAEACDQIIRELKERRGKRRALFFLDQYGYGDVPLGLVRQVLANIDGSEIILTFAIDALINYLSDEERFKAVQPVALTRSRIAELRKLWDKSGSSARYVVQNALYDHIARVTGAPQSSPFFVRSKTSKRAYWLVHLSKHHTSR